MRQVEVELHGRELPQTADGVHQLDVNLRPIERGFAGHGLVLYIQALERVFERSGSRDPLFFRAQEALPLVRVPGGKLGLVLVEAEGFQHGERELHAADDLVLDLFGGAENMGVVLGEAADAQQPVHHARTLVPIDRTEFAQPHRQVAVRLQRIFVDQDVARTVHGLQAIFGVVQFHGVEHVV